MSGRSSVLFRYTTLFRSRVAFFMIYYVYIIYAASIDQYYVGHSDDLQDRLFRHNNSGSKATKKANDWVTKYTEPCETRAAAMKREIEIKKKKSRKYIEWLISSTG